jgi:hypothetical protein
MAALPQSSSSSTSDQARLVGAHIVPEEARSCEVAHVHYVYFTADVQLWVAKQRVRHT